MPSKRHQKSSDLFRPACEIAPDTRAAFLEEACAGDTKLRAEVEALLAQDEQHPRFLEYPAKHEDQGKSAPETESIRADRDRPGSAKRSHAKTGTLTGHPEGVGPYKILQELGEGGMGVVYLAEQTEPIRRRVALKLIKLGMDTKQVIARFETERQALALMNHPNVAKVLDAGTTEKGRPYFVMEYVKGESITAYCDRHRLTTRERLELFMQVCHAVQHAHQKAIIHRDIKPSNVLVAIEGDKPVPKVIDFSVAKATEHKLTERTLFTEQGQLIGTPEYMSPEQAEMTVLDIDTRTDIYSLGVLLYELLVGALPFDPTSLRRAAFAEIQRIIREEEPPRPSTRLSSLGDDSASAAKKRRTDPSTLAKQLRGDLDWITMKAMDKDRTRRYATASDLADDIARNLKNEPVEASPPSATYRLQKFVRRNRGLVVSANLVLLALVVGLAVATSQWFRAEANEKRAQQQVIEVTKATEKERVARAETSRALYRSYVALARMAWRENDRGEMKRWLERCPQSLRRWEWGFLARQRDVSLRTLRGRVLSVAFRPDGMRIVSRTNSRTLKVWDAATGEEVVMLRGRDGPGYPVAFSPDGMRIVSRTNSRTLKVWDATSGEEVVTLRGHDGTVWSVAFSPDGTRIVSGSDDRTIKVWDAASGDEVLTLRGHYQAVTCVAFSPDGTRIVSGSSDKTLKVWDAASGEEILTLRGHVFTVASVAFSPDGTRIVSGSHDKTLKVWDATSGEEVLTLRGHHSHVNSVAFSPDGTRIVSGSWDKTLKVWDARSGEEVLTLRGHDNHVNSVAFSPDGTRIVSGSRDETLKIWDTAEPGKGYDAMVAEWRAKLPQPDTDDDRSPDPDGPTTQEDSKQTGDD